MHCFTSVSFLIVSTSALSGVFGNPIDNPASDATNPILYRRGEDKVKIYYAYSIFSKDYEPKAELSKSSHLPLCGDRGVEPGPNMTEKMAKATFDAQGIYFDEHKQWNKNVSNRFVELPMGCFESTDGPQTIFGNSLKPYTSVITQMYNNGTKLFIKELYGVKLGEKEHNGCVQVVDTSMGDGHIYLYVVIEDRKKEFFKGINKVTATEKEDCEIIEYEMVL